MYIHVVCMCVCDVTDVMWQCKRDSLLCVLATRCAACPGCLYVCKLSHTYHRLFVCAGNFMPGGENGTIMKKSGENESNALQGLNGDPAMKNFVPEFKREVEHQGEGTSPYPPPPPSSPSLGRPWGSLCVPWMLCK